MAFGIGPTALLAVFFTLLRSSGYPFWSPEVFLALTIVILLGSVLGLTIALSPLIVRIGIYSCLLALVSNALLRPYPELEWFLTDDSAYFIAIICVSVVLLMIAKTKSDEILIVVFSAVLLSSLFVGNRPTAWLSEIDNTTVNKQSDLPPYIHIVLDAQIGLEGLPEIVDSIGRFKSSIRKSYRDLGYKVYGNVHVRTPPQSILSFRNFLGFIHVDGSKHVTRLPVKTQNTLGGPNKIFSSLDQMGYLINVIQSSHLDLCNNSDSNFRIHSCRTYPFNRFFD